MGFGILNLTCENLMKNSYYIEERRKMKRRKNPENPDGFELGEE